MVGLEQIILSVPAVLLALSMHEYAHGVIADRLGDPTPRIQGRLTLNPLKHLDPIGALMLLLFRFGWAKPVMVDARHFRDPRKGMMLVGLGGPVMNVILAYAFALTFRYVPSLFALPGIGDVLFAIMHPSVVTQFFQLNVIINLWLAAFNLIPIPPLDGSRVLAGILPREGARLMSKLEPIGPLILMAFIFTGAARFVLTPIINLLGHGLRYL